MSAANTFVWKIDAAAATQLEKRLRENDFEFRDLAYAHFQARGDGMVINCYQSGKLVVQGKCADAFEPRFLMAGGVASSLVEKKEKEAAAPKEPTADFVSALPAIGSDEAGKGDTFGGITVAAVYVDEVSAKLLAEAGVTDSKKIADRRIQVLATWIRKEFPFQERVLTAAQYNRQHAENGSNVNQLLTVLHAAALHDLQKEAAAKYAIIDRFSPRCPVRLRLAESDPSLEVFEVPRAEAHPAVAAASVLARDAFLTQRAEMSVSLAMSIPLGSGSPVPPALRKFLSIHGSQSLPKAVKQHFSNVKKQVARYGD